MDININRYNVYCDLYFKRSFFFFIDLEPGNYGH